MRCYAIECAVMRKVILFFLSAISLQVFAQKQERFVADYKGFCATTFPKVLLKGDVADEAVAAFLKGYSANLNAPDVTLQFKYKTESPGGWHFGFVQLYRGIEVYQSEIKVNINRNNIVTSVLDNSFYTKGWNVDVAMATEGAVIAVDRETKEAFLASRVIENGFEIIRRNGNEFYRRDTRSYANQDSVVTGNVFNPDPLTTAHQVYTGTDLDQNDTNSPWLQAELKPVTFVATYTGSQFQLWNQYVTIKDIDSPQVLPAISLDGTFNFNRSQTGFEDVNAFYHLNNMRNHVHTLGFNIADQLVWVDTHSGTADQSYFSPMGLPPTLNYGTGGIDDAEDADVLTHEYGHFLSYNASPGSNLGSERSSLDEAFGDYVAASYSKALDTYKSEWVFNWDGHNNYWNGRVVNSSKVYPTNLISGSVYKNAEIWSALLMNIHDDLGRLATDSLIFEAHYGYAADMSMTDAGYLLLQADSDLTGGHYHCRLLQHMFDRGIIAFDPGNDCGLTALQEQVLNNVSFINSNDFFGIKNESAQPLQVSVVAVTGSVISTVEESQQLYTYHNAYLPAGIYLVHVQGTNGSKTFKWCKAQ